MPQSLPSSIPFRLAFLLVVVLGMSPPGWADVPASLVVDPGSTAVITLQIEVTGPDGTETQSDSRVVPIGGDGAVRFTPDSEPFDGMILDALTLRPGDSTLQYEFFCNPLFGCVTVTVDLRNLTATLLQPAGASIVGDQVGWGAEWRLVGEYGIQSILFDSGGVIDVVATPGFNGRLSVGNGGWRLDQMTLGTIVSDVPADSLPDGISVRLFTSVGLGGAALAGNYVPPPPPPPPGCGTGGDCNRSHGGPGCNDVACCIAVCDLDPACCDSVWDDGCVNLAVTTCGLSPANDRCDQARPLSLGRFAFTSVNADTDGDPLPTACVDEETAGTFVGDVWFTHTASQDNGVLVSTCGHADFDTRIAVYTACDGAILTCSDNVAECPGGTSRCGFVGLAGETYLIRVGGKFGTGVGEIDIAWGDVASPVMEIAPSFVDGPNANGNRFGVVTLTGDGSWADAVATAASFGGRPATLTSAEENDFVVVNARPSNVGGPTVFGLLQSGADVEPDGGWGWITGEAFRFSNWNPGEPNDAGEGGEDFATIYADGRWNDAAEGFGHVLVEFEREPSLEEVVWSEGEGGQGQRYRAVIEEFPVTWSQAEAAAAALGGSLVSLETEAEADFVFERLVAWHALWTGTNYNGGPWIGLRNDAGVWRWLTGDVLDWAAWMPGEPNGTGDRACFFSYFDGPRRQFDDTFDGNVRRTFVVEFDPVVECVGDLTGDQMVDGADLGLLLGLWGECDGGCAADLTGDRLVDGADLGLMLGRWGLCR